MDFALGERAQDYVGRLQAFMDEHVYPAEAPYARFREEAGYDNHELPPVVEDLKNEAKSRGLTYVSLDGTIGIIGNGAGLCMGTLDIVQRAGGAAANFCDIGGGARAEVVQNAMEVILMNPKVRGILVNIFGGITRGDEVARGLVTARDRVGLKLPLVVRLSGTNQEEGREILKQNGIEPGVNAWEAAEKIVELTR